MFTEPFITIARSVDVFMLILARMLGMFFIAPVFGRNSIPPAVKIGLSILFSYILLPAQFFQLNEELTTMKLSYLVVKELTIGLGLGFVAQVFFGIFLTAGAIMDLNIGFSMSRLYDPQTGSQVTVTSKLLDLFAYLVFFAVDGHHFLIKALLNSYLVLPIGSDFVVTDSYLRFFTKLITYLFTSAVTVGMPILISIFMANLLLAFMAKIMPQMNVFIVGMPLKIFLGFIILSVSLPFMTRLFKEIFYRMFQYIYLFTNMIKGL
ncbi:MAG: flagellar biosynthetic protein FliR [Peptostreptococcaceae bacterium]|nr:flagellar biosynthetic protein FliR [Peptostreptococcaceae bacterium]